MAHQHIVASFLIACTLGACGSDGDGGSPAQHLGVGALCSADTPCPVVSGMALQCLPFKGGYCGLSGCTKDADCPAGSACVTEGATNYCFLVCTDKSQCNYGRPVADESNCSSSITFVEAKNGVKACVPPT